MPSTYTQPSANRDAKVLGAPVLVALSVVACVAAFFFEARTGFNLWDEGFLWYGVQRVLQGEVPIRDFMAYNPGRYYWAAAWLKLFDAQGIVAVRAATAAFSAIGVAIGTFLVLRGSRARGALRGYLCVLAIALFLTWMVPWWKGYDAAISIILIASLARVLARPSIARFFVHGVVVGLAAVLGRNHGVYGVVACLLATPVLMLAAKPDWRRCIPAWIGGVVAGFSPMLIGLILDDRFSAMFWNDLHYLLFVHKGATLPVPVPWPWTVDFGQTAALAGARLWFVGCFFLALPIFCIVGAAAALRQARNERVIAHPIFVASVVTAIPYLNVAFSRADVSHLAQAIFPMLIGLMTFPWARLKWPINGVMLPVITAGSLLATMPLHPGYVSRTQPGWQAVSVRGDSLRMPKGTANSIDGIHRLAHRYVPAEGTLLAAPVWPGAYALLGVRSPVWDIYPLLPRDDAFQAQEIARIRQARPALVLINDVSLDRREDRRYANSHPLIWHYINTHYQKVADAEGDPNLLVYIPKTAMPVDGLPEAKRPPAKGGKPADAAPDR